MVIGRPLQERCVVLRRRNTVVVGKCALPSALVFCVCILVTDRQTNERTDGQRQCVSALIMIKIDDEMGDLMHTHFIEKNLEFCSKKVVFSAQKRV